MFTDIVGYTKLMQESEARGLELRNRHRQVVESTHAERNGRVIQYLGDGTLSIFDSVIDCVHAAISIQEQLSVDPKVPLRIGIHVGDVLITETDIIGDSVNLASRVESLAVPGAVLISNKVKVEIRNQPIPIEFLGTFHFKNDELPRKIYAVSSKGLVVPDNSKLQGKIEPVKQANNQTQVPAELTNFIGRQQELSEIIRLLDDVRLVTMSGPGGTGKTRLSREILRQVGPSYRDGAYFVQLAPLTDHSQVLPKISQILSLHQDPTKETKELLQEFIQDKQILLVLDNFEHVVEAATDLADIMRSCPNLKVLVTSRVVLNISGEYEYQVPVFDLPELSRDYEIEELKNVHAVQFFTDRVLRVKTNFELNLQNCDAVIRICNQLDGLPLALELAAARMKIFSLEALSRRLDVNRDVLRSNSPDQPERHRTLKNAIDWSYNLLSPEEQTLFRRLAVFGGGCSLEAAGIVCFHHDQSNIDVVDVLLGLVDKSLVQRADQSDGEPRFFMLETIRAYGLDRLEKSLEREDIMSRFAAYFSELVVGAKEGLTGPEAKEWLRVIDQELDNLRAIMGWLEKEKEAERGLQLCVSFWRYWLIRAMVREGAEWFARMLALPPQIDTILRCRSLGYYAVLNDLASSLPILEQSLAMARKLDYQEGAAQALKYMTWIYAFQCEFDLFEAHYEQILDTLVPLGNERDIAAVYNNLGNKLRMEGRLSESEETFQKAAEVMQSIRDDRGYAFNQCHIAWVKSLVGDHKACDFLLDLAKPILVELDDKQLLGYLYTIRAFNFCYQTRHEESMHLIVGARPLWKEYSNQYGALMCDIIAAMNWLQLEHIENLQQVFSLHAKRVPSKMYLTLRLWITQLQTRHLMRSDNLSEAIAQTKRNIEEQFKHRTHLIVADDLELSAQQLHRYDQYADAARIFAYAQKVRHETQVVVPLIWRAEHAELERKINKSIDPKDLAAYLDEGSALDSEGAWSIVRAFTP